jgi:hypothetical protein
MPSNAPRKDPERPCNPSKACAAREEKINAIKQSQKWDGDGSENRIDKRIHMCPRPGRSITSLCISTSLSADGEIMGRHEAYIKSKRTGVGIRH